MRTLTLGIGNEGDSLAALISENKRYRSTYIIGKPGKRKSALMGRPLQDQKHLRLRDRNRNSTRLPYSWPPMGRA